MKGNSNTYYQMFEAFVNLEVNRSVEANLNDLKSLLESEAPDDS